MSKKAMLTVALILAMSVKVLAYSNERQSSYQWNILENFGITFDMGNNSYEMIAHYANSTEDKDEKVIAQPLPDIPPVSHTINNYYENRISSANIIRLLDNIILNILMYSPSEAAQEISNNRELYLNHNFEPNEVWIRENTRDLTPYGNFIVEHDPYTNKSTAFSSETNNPLDIDLYKIDMLTKAKMQILIDPCSAFPSREEIKEHMGLSQLPEFSVSMPFYDGQHNNIDNFSVANREQVAVPTTGRYLGIVFIEAQFPNTSGWHVSAGFLTNANTVVTAGHNLFNPSRGGWATSVRVTPGRNAAFMPHDTIYARSYFVDGHWHSGSNQNHDWGAIRLSQNANLSTSNFWSLVTRTDAQLNNLNISMTGYPGDDRAVPLDGMFRSWGRVTALPTTHLIDTNAFGSQGVSGGPVYSSAGVALAIARGSVAVGLNPGNTRTVRIRQDMINTLLTHRWP